MNCTDVQAQLDDYVDGLLTEPQESAVSGHLRECAACRRLETELRCLIEEAGRLSRASQPAQDLWAGIAERIGTRKDRPQDAAIRTISIRPGMVRALAAAALVLLALSAFFFVPRAGEKPSGFTPDSTPAAYERAEAEYLEARETLLNSIRSREDALPPSTLETVRENMRVIDSAVAEIRTALADDPDNQKLLQMLLFAYRKEVDFLSRIARLSAQG